MPTPKGWYAYANAVYAQKPQVQQMQVVDLAREQKKVAADAGAKAAKEARQAEEQRLQEAATRHSTRPTTIHANASAGVRDTDTSDANKAIRMMSPGQQKRARRSRVRTWGQQAQK